MTDHTTTNRLITPSGRVVTPVTAGAIADALVSDWFDLLDATGGDGDRAWALFEPPLAEAFAQAVTDWWHQPIDGVTNAERFPEAARARQQAP